MVWDSVKLLHNAEKYLRSMLCCKHFYILSRLRFCVIKDRYTNLNEDLFYWVFIQLPCSLQEMILFIFNTIEERGEKAGHNHLISLHANEERSNQAHPSHSLPVFPDRMTHHLSNPVPNTTTYYSCSSKKYEGLRKLV